MKLFAYDAYDVYRLRVDEQFHTREEAQFVVKGNEAMIQIHFQMKILMDMFLGLVREEQQLQQLHE